MILDRMNQFLGDPVVTDPKHLVKMYVLYLFIYGVLILLHTVMVLCALMKTKYVMAGLEVHRKVKYIHSSTLAR